MARNKVFTAYVNGKTYRGVTNPYFTEVIYKDLRNMATAIENLDGVISLWYDNLEIKFQENENGEYKPIAALQWEGDCIVDEYEVKGTKTILDIHQERMAKRAAKEEKEKRIASFNKVKALRLMLQRMGAESHFEECLKILSVDSDFSFRQIDKSVYQFTSTAMARELGLLAYIFIIDVDVDRYDAFCNSLKRRFSRFDMFEIMKYDDCVIAFD